jgi:hypothetical protein
MIMGDSEDQSVLDRYPNINLAVVEVRNGESQEEAWRRHLRASGLTLRFSKPSPTLFHALLVSRFGRRRGVQAAALKPRLDLAAIEPETSE